MCAHLSQFNGRMTMSFIDDAKENMAEGFEKAKDAAGDMSEKAKDMAGDVSEFVQEKAGEVSEFVKDVFDGEDDAAAPPA